MKNISVSAILFLVLSGSYVCSGHLSLLDGLLSAPHQIHTKIKETASSVIGGLAHGLDLNINGHIEVGHGQYGQGPPPGPPRQPPPPYGQRPPPYGQQPPPYGQQPPPYGQQPPPYGQQPPPETVIVVVQEEDNPSNNPAQNPNYGQHYNTQYKPNGNNLPFGNGNQNNGYQYQKPNGGGESLLQGGQSYPQGGPHNYNNNNQQQNSYTNNPVGNEQYVDKNKNKPEEVTKKPDNDLPLFVPLNPNELPADDKNNSTPKRDTQDEQSAADNDDFPIDIRYGGGE